MLRKEEGRGLFFFFAPLTPVKMTNAVIFYAILCCAFFRIVLHHNALLGSLMHILFHCRLAAFLDGETNVLFVKNKTIP